VPLAESWGMGGGDDAPYHYCWPIPMCSAELVHYVSRFPTRSWPEHVKRFFKTRFIKLHLESVFELLPVLPSVVLFPQDKWIDTANIGLFRGREPFLVCAFAGRVSSIFSARLIPPLFPKYNAQKRVHFVYCWRRPDAPERMPVLMFSQNTYAGGIMNVVATPQFAPIAESIRAFFSQLGEPFRPVDSGDPSQVAFAEYMADLRNYWSRQHGSANHAKGSQ